MERKWGWKNSQPPLQMSNLPRYETIADESAFHKNHWSIKIFSGKYEDVVYQYDTIKLLDEGEIRYNTIVIDNPNDLDLNAPEFVMVMGGILQEIIEESVRKNDTGNGNTSKPSAQ